MTDQASTGGWGKYALVTVPAIVLTGSAMGWVSGSGYGNDWFDRLTEPSFMPPGWLFGVAWTFLYTLLGAALAMILALPPSPERRTALILFFIQLALNFSWSPIFFGAHDIVLAKYVIFVMAIIAAVTARHFYRLNRVAGLLMVPYLMWLVFAATLNATFDRLNPGAGTSLLGL